MTLADYRDLIDLTPINHVGGLLSEGDERALLGELTDELAAEEPRLPAALLMRAPRELFEILRTLRPPDPISDEFLSKQDKLLWSDTLRRGIVHTDGMDARGGISLWQGDITRLDADGIVNAANSAMLGCFQPLHNCIDNVINLRGGMQIRRDCNMIMNRQGHEEPAGRAKITRAYNLPSKYVLHTVGPIVERTAGEREEARLKSCYTACLDLAREAGLRSLAFCCISTGVFRFPKEPACRIAVSAVREWLARAGGIHVIFNVFSDEDRELYERVLQ